MFPNAGSVMPHLKAGRVRGLAVTTPEPTPLAPGLPTIASSGVPGYEWISTIVMFAPSRTPSALVSRLNREIVNVLNTVNPDSAYSVQAPRSSPARRRS
jgi:tripartite-type tricarboxylate transporter receptor subunit TctC